jgi:hypothetical protein
MVCFQTKNPKLHKFWRALELKLLEYFIVIWNILQSFGIPIGTYCCGNLVYFPRFGILCQEKSGNPARSKEIFFLSTSLN